jgi:putative ABC transport system substrate-binding protein
MIRRREFIAGLGSAAAWPVVARAQQGEQVRRLGVLLGWDDNDTLAEAWFSGFTQGMSELGWTDGRNLRMDVRWAAGNIGRMRMYAKALAGLGPEVILASSTPVTAAFQRETQIIPIVFAGISDPVGAGFVASLARPGGNITGFINIGAAIGGKWLQLLTEIEPAIKRVAIMFNPDTAPGAGTFI